MAIRLRCVDGMVVALCAARSVEKPGDIYLDGNAHHALYEKFLEDAEFEGYNTMPLDDRLMAIRTLEETNTRGSWDRASSTSKEKSNCPTCGKPVIESTFPREPVWDQLRSACGWCMCDDVHNLHEKE